METGTKLVLFPVKIPFYRENREDSDTAVPVTQCNELCIFTVGVWTVYGVTTRRARGAGVNTSFETTGTCIVRRRGASEGGRV
jgi:hypothetical protein